MKAKLTTKTLSRMLVTTLALLACSNIAFCDDPPKAVPLFDAVIWKEAADPQISLLHIVITQADKSHDALCKLVLKTAPKALLIADQYRPKKFNIVYEVRSAATDAKVTMTGFSYEQLQEYTKLPEEKALTAIKKHSWTLGNIPNP